MKRKVYAPNGRFIFTTNTDKCPLCNVEIGDEIVCYCPNCCQIRKEKLKDSEVEK